MVKIRIVFLVLMFATTTTFAGGIYDLAKVKNISYKASGDLVVEFDGLEQGKHFMSRLPPGIKKMRLSYLNWPKGSRHSAWWYKILPWTQRSGDFDSKNFEDCVDLIFESYKSESSFHFGQIGGGDFELSKESSDEVVVPYLHLEKTSDGRVCFIDLG